MGQRRVLVIGSQWAARPPPLSFLPDLAQELYAVMTDPNLGGCVPALGDNGLRIDPCVAQARDVIKAAFQRASEDEATLFLAFIGHGEYDGTDFYLMLRDTPNTPDSDTAINLVLLIKEQHGRYNHVDGLVVLLDACHAGVGAVGAAAKWVGELRGRLRFEVLTATDDLTAADGCFSRNIVAVIREGVVGGESTIQCGTMGYLLNQRCGSTQEAQLAGYNYYSDKGLYLARNVAVRAEPWGGMEAVAAEVERLTAWFEPPPQLAEVVALSEDHRCVALVGVAGAGKSALAAALARPEVCERIVPDCFAQAVSFLSESTTSSALAGQLAAQLQASAPGFAAAQGEFHGHTTKEELAGLDPLRRDVIGPLRWLGDGRNIRLVVDGLDQLSATAAHIVHGALDLLATDSALRGIRLVVTSRPETWLPPVSKKFEVGRADDPQILAYLARRNVSPNLREAIVDRADGIWLVARLLADLGVSGAAAAELPEELVVIYDRALRQAGASDRERLRKELRPVLAVLAAAGTGPILPIRLLCAASGKLGGPERVSRVRDVLVDLRGFVVRAEPGSADERVGLFHPTFAGYLFDQKSVYRIDPKDAHRGLAEVIDALVPMEKHRPGDRLNRYAAAREADHLWAIGEHARALDSLEQRELPTPAENLDRWRRWHNALGPDHPDIFTTRRNVAHWTGEVGDANEALRLLQELLREQRDVIQPDHHSILSTRSKIAYWTGKTGDPNEALRLFRELLPNQERVLGPDHRDTLSTRNNIAHCTGETGDRHEALRLFRELLPDQERVLGSDDRDTLRTRSNIAGWSALTGAARDALRLYQELLPDRERFLGPDDPDTLATRINIAQWAGANGDKHEALRLFQGLLSDVERVGGRDHRDTLSIRNNIAHWTGRAGNVPEALRLYQELLPDQERVLGSDDRDALRTRSNIAVWTAMTGDRREALRLYQELLPDQERALGPDDPDTLATLSYIASLTA